MKTANFINNKMHYIYVLTILTLIAVRLTEDGGIIPKMILSALAGLLLFATLLTLKYQRKTSEDDDEPIVHDDDDPEAPWNFKKD